MTIKAYPVLAQVAGLRPPGLMVALWWFDKNSNTSYKLSYGGDDVITIFEPLGTFSNSNVAAAQKLAAMANQLVVWPGS